jgi:hypothetical protein
MKTAWATKGAKKKLLEEFQARIRTPIHSAGPRGFLSIPAAKARVSA